jgi:hypothetical protein
MGSTIPQLKWYCIQLQCRPVCKKKNKERKGVERLQTKSVGDVREGDGVLLSLKRWFR